MPTTLLARFLGRFTSGDSEHDGDDSSFLASTLDYAVQYGSAGGREEVDREIARIQQQADEIEQRRHK